jgi:hypothetical protein
VLRRLKIARDLVEFTLQLRHQSRLALPYNDVDLLCGLGHEQPASLPRHLDGYSSEPLRLLREDRRHLAE